MTPLRYRVNTRMVGDARTVTFLTYRCPQGSRRHHCSIGAEHLDEVVVTALIEQLLRLTEVGDRRLLVRAWGGQDGPRMPSPDDAPAQPDQSTRIAVEEAERFIAALSGASVRSWPQWFSAEHPDLAQACLRNQIREDFQRLSLAIRRAIVQATSEVAVLPATAPHRIAVRPRHVGGFTIDADGTSFV